MRTLCMLLAATAMVIGAVGTASAGPNDRDNTTLGLVIGGLPSITITPEDSNPGNAVLSDVGAGEHQVADTKTLWSTVDLGPGTALFTGVPLITDLRVTVRNQIGFFFEDFNPDAITENGGANGIFYMDGPKQMGGYERLSGQAVIYAFGGAVQLPISLGAIGFANGATEGGSLLENPIVYTGGPWSTGWITITNITTNVVTVPSLTNQVGVAVTLDLTENQTAMALTTLNGYASTMTLGIVSEQHTVTLHGTNSLLSASKPGMVTLISPLRIDTGAIAGLLPGKIVKKFVFVPEPGTMLLLVSGAIGLVAVGRRRMRK